MNASPTHISCMSCHTQNSYLCNEGFEPLRLGHVERYFIQDVFYLLGGGLFLHRGSWPAEHAALLPPSVALSIQTSCSAHVLGGCRQCKEVLHQTITWGPAVLRLGWWDVVWHAVHAGSIGACDALILAAAMARRFCCQVGAFCDTLEVPYGKQPYRGRSLRHPVSLMLLSPTLK